MAKSPTNLRDAVEKTVEATLGSAGRSRSAAQGALDDFVESVEDLRKGAEERLSRGRRSMADVIEGRRPATSEDIKELKAELRAIGRRLDKIEERLPAKRGAAKRGATKTRAPRAREAALGRRQRVLLQARLVVAGRRVLITGVGSHVGSLLAAQLERDPDVEYVAGLDTRRPKLPLEQTEFIHSDIRDPEIGRLIPPTGVDTIVHEQIVRQPGPGMSPRAMHDINVIGTLQLLAACERVPTLRTIVVRGSAGVYGAEPQAPQFFKEEMARLFPLRTRFQRDVAEIENYFETYARRHEGVGCTMLRYQPAIGPGMRTQITRYLSQPVCPTFLGFDPRIQLVHIDDALEAIVAAVRNPVRGAVNVAGPGTIGLTRMIRLVGKRALPIAAPLFGAVTSTGQRLGLDTQSDDFQRLLRYGRGVDTRRLTDEVGYTPRHSTVDAVESWAGHARVAA